MPIPWQRRMAAFANSEGGTIFIGVTDDGTLPGLDKADVARLNQLISNAASQNVRSPLTVQSANVAVGKGHVVIVLTIPKGLDKPYFDRNGVNSPGVPEILKSAFEELLVNALIHRDYLVNITIRLFTFDDNIGIIDLV